MLYKQKRVRNVLVNNRTSDDLGWVIMEECERNRWERPGRVMTVINNDESSDETELKLDSIQSYLVTTMANRDQ